MKLLENKIVIVTGASRGIGKSIAEECVNQGATVIFTYLSSKEKAEALEAELSVNGGVAKGYKSDASKFDEAQELVDNVVSEFGTVDVLINNAGIMACPETRINEIWESQFAVNQIGHFLLTNGLMDSMKKSEDSRLVSLSSSAHSISGIIWDDIHFKSNPYDKWVAYGQSKTASSLLAIEFNRRMKDHGGKGFAVHPGGIITPLQRHLQNEEMVAFGWTNEDGSLSDFAQKHFKTPTQGASTSLWCATSPMLNEIDGVFCENCNVAERKANLDESMLRYFGVADWAIDTDEASKLWDKTEAMLSQ